MRLNGDSRRLKKRKYTCIRLYGGEFIVPSEASNSVHLNEFRSNVGYQDDLSMTFPMVQGSMWPDSRRWFQLGLVAPGVDNGCKGQVDDGPRW